MIGETAAQVEDRMRQNIERLTPHLGAERAKKSFEGRTRDLPGFGTPGPDRREAHAAA